MAHDVFISHSSKDKPTADAVCAVLESHGIRCWVAPRDIIPGMDWGASIIEAIKGARVMVLIFSGHANDSSQIKLEVERAVNKGVPIIPLRIEDILPTDALELFLGARHWLDAFTPPLENHLQMLAQIIRQFPGVTPVGTAPNLASGREAREKAGAEAARAAEEKRKAEDAARVERLNEENRKAEETARLAEEQRKAAEAAERALLIEKKRIADEAAKRAEENRAAREASGSKTAIAPEAAPAAQTRAKEDKPAVSDAPVEDLLRRVGRSLRKIGNWPTWQQTVWLCVVMLALVFLGRLHSDDKSGGSAHGPLTALDWVGTPLITAAILLSLGLLANLAIVRHWSFPKRLKIYLPASLLLGVVGETGWSIVSAPTMPAPGNVVNAFYRSPLRGLDDIIDTQISTAYLTNSGFTPTIFNTAQKTFIPAEAYLYKVDANSLSQTNGTPATTASSSAIDAFNKWSEKNPALLYSANLKTLWIVVFPINSLLWFAVLTAVFEIFCCRAMNPRCVEAGRNSN